MAINKESMHGEGAGGNAKPSVATSQPHTPNNAGNAQSADRMICSDRSSDTMTSFETAVNLQADEVVSTETDQTASRSNRAKKKTKIQTKKKLSAGEKIKSKARRPSRSMFAIQTEADQSQDGDPDGEGQIWEATYRGMPSWLSSLIIHLTIILLLALLTINNSGKSSIDLFAATDDVVSIDPLETFQIALDPEEIETVSHDMETPDSQMLETDELEPVLDDALLMSGLENNVSDSFLNDALSDGSQVAQTNEAEGGGAKFFGVEGEGTDFVFVVDCSGSMADYGRWNRAVGELKRSIKKLNSKQKFLILLYNDGYVAMNKDVELVKSSDREQKRAFRWLARKRPDSWTFCAEALAKALSLGPDAIFLLSDGEFDDRADVFFVLESMNNAAKLRAEERRQIPIHTVALGSHHGRFTMKRIADENSGSFELIE